MNHPGTRKSKNKKLRTDSYDKKMYFLLNKN